MVASGSASCWLNTWTWLPSIDRYSLAFGPLILMHISLPSNAASLSGASGFGEDGSSPLAQGGVAAAVGPGDELARFSNYGPTTVDLAAPGVGIWSTEPDSLYASRNGTSMAAPHVTGVAALIWSHVPTATASATDSPSQGAPSRGRSTAS